MGGPRVECYLFYGVVISKKQAKKYLKEFQHDYYQTFLKSYDTDDWNGFIKHECFDIEINEHREFLSGIEIDGKRGYFLVFSKFIDLYNDYNGPVDINLKIDHDRYNYLSSKLDLSEIKLCSYSQDCDD